MKRSSSTGERWRRSGCQATTVSLLGLGGAILASIALTALATGLTSFVIDLVGLSAVPGIGGVTALLGILIAIAGGTLIFLWLFIRLPHVDAPVRAVLPGALFGASASRS